MEVGFRKSILKWTPHEKSEPISSAVVLADLVGTLYRMSGRANVWLSPEAPIRGGFKSFYECAIYAKVVGFEEEGESVGFGEQCFTYSIDELVPFYGRDSIEQAVVGNFGKGGRSYPMMGLVRREKAGGGFGFGFERQAMLIIGVDTTSSKHYCLVKDYSKKKGVFKFLFDAFEFVCLPKMSDDK